MHSELVVVGQVADERVVAGSREVGEENARLARLQRAARVEHALEGGRLFVDGPVRTARKRIGGLMML